MGSVATMPPFRVVGRSARKRPRRAEVLGIHLGIHRRGLMWTRADRRGIESLETRQIWTVADRRGHPTSPFKEEVRGSNPLRATRPDLRWNPVSRAQERGREDMRPDTEKRPKREGRAILGREQSSWTATRASFRHGRR